MIRTIHSAPHPMISAIAIEPCKSRRVPPWLRALTITAAASFLLGHFGETARAADQINKVESSRSGTATATRTPLSGDAAGDSTQARAEKEIDAPPGANPSTAASVPVVFPDFKDIDREQREGANQPRPRTCRLDGRTYQEGETMYQSCMSELRAQSIEGHPSSAGKSHGGGTGAGAASMGYQDHSKF